MRSSLRGSPEPLVADLTLLAFYTLPPARAARARRRQARAIALAAYADSTDAGVAGSVLDSRRAEVVRRAGLACTRPGTPLPLVGTRRGQPAHGLRALPPAARAAWVMLEWQRLPQARVEQILLDAGVPDPATSVNLAGRSAPLLGPVESAWVLAGRPRRSESLWPAGAAVAAGALAVTFALTVSDVGASNIPDPASSAVGVAVVDRPAVSPAASRARTRAVRPRRAVASKLTPGDLAQAQRARALREVRRLLDAVGVGLPADLLR